MITEYGLEKVKEDYDEVKEHIEKCKIQLQKAYDSFKLAEKQLNCDHPPNQLVCYGWLELCQTDCKKCGYSWFD